VDVEAPAGATPIEQIIGQSKDNQNAYGVAADASLKANISSLRARAEIVYGNNNSYGAQAFFLGPCKQTASTMFGDAALFKLISEATKDKPSTATCVSTGTAGNIQTYAVSAPLPGSPEFSYCVDSTGTAMQIRGAIKAAKCN
jgi:hypothetical protein